jgi:sulfonate transport system substrate-binding protein
MNILSSLIPRALVGAMVLAALLGMIPNPSYAEEKLTELHLGYQKYGTLVLLKANGALEKRLAAEGIKVTWAEFQGGVPLLEALNVGSVDFGTAGDAPPIVAQAAGANFVYVGVEPPAPAGESIIVKEDSPIRSAADLKGKRIASSKGGNVHYLTLQSLSKSGLTSKDVEWSWLFPADARPAFESGQIDAWAVWDPFLAAVQTDLKVRVIADGTYANVANYQFYLATRALAEKHPAVVKIVLEEIAKVDRQALADLSPVIKTLTQSTGIKEAAVSLALKRMGYAVKPLSAEIVASQQRLADTFLKEGLIRKPIVIKDAVAAAGL